MLAKDIPRHGRYGVDTGKLLRIIKGVSEIYSIVDNIVVESDSLTLLLSIC